jgi:hypothetical protein
VAVTHAEATRERERYASALADLWHDLRGTLAELDRLAADPTGLTREAPEALPALQYALHRTAELAAGITPPQGAESAHGELAAALLEARDVTGDVAAALDDEGERTAAALVPEWRGTLFRVRLARRALTTPRSLPLLEAAEPGGKAAAVTSVALVLAGTAAFTSGAVLGLWPLWAAGLLLVACSFLAYRV